MLAWKGFYWNVPRPRHNNSACVVCCEVLVQNNEVADEYIWIKTYKKEEIRKLPVRNEYLQPNARD